ncbi:DNA mismatch repair protein MutL [Anaerobranca californiensis DSM 14826]|jgi:DNA mismatch repair protein MutL|uniref:DNA mismatch repair protein MutL n=1 Tax=Anaerobranca californiensis DSM 14826 TaxID=1120989 RepID=A0A1M6KA83_9FIRM|nr:DNA mismatch repair endonuclease MutL [Anaerobranca californiensis]SHJ55814.1 DNA mismatch repair protein MutL [Anaerobranca californiensis DSM 14826]
MGIINILPPQTANKIAAGEVVERPASIVKELIENSIDGKSTNITINLVNAGKEKIEVIDNGVGIHKDDVPIAFLRHATSKIKDEKDLEKISSLGFRGEALPSIAAVSKVTLITRTTGEDFGVKYVIEGGKERLFDVAPANLGTRIIVEDLFFNTPARRKFLKTTATELNYITDLVGRFIMSHPHISFQLTHNNKPLIKSSGDGDLKHCLSEVMGWETAENSIEVDFSYENMTVTGLIIKPVLTKSSRSGQMFFVNNRIVKSSMLAKALEAGFNTLIPIGRYPQGVLNIQIQVEDLDVNVHPSKQEIKFKDEKAVFYLVKEGVENALKNKSLISEFKHTNVSRQLLNPGNREKIPKESEVSKAIEESSVLEIKEIEYTTPIYSHNVTSIKDSTNSLSQPAQQVFDLPEEEQYLHPFFKTLKILGQYANSYIIAVDSEQIYLIDQHAAQEKIYYERALTQMHTKPIIQQIVPMTLELKKGYREKIQENLELFISLGFDLDFLDGNNIIVRGLPFFINKTVSLQLLFDALEELIFNDDITAIKKYKEAVLALISCKGAIKANHKLSFMEMEQLVKDLGKISNPYSCPHGRPVIVSLDKYSVEKLFKRVT